MKESTNSGKLAIWYDQRKEKVINRQLKVKRHLEYQRIRRIRKKSIPNYTHCKNCGTKLEGMYCHHCGQYALDSQQPFWKYVAQYFENFYQVDNKIPITLYMLFRKPGFLTEEFKAGKIKSYVHPVRLNMFILLIFVTVSIFLVSNKYKETHQANLVGFVNSFETDQERNDAFQRYGDTTVFFIGRSQEIQALSEYMSIDTLFSSPSSDTIPSLDKISYKYEQTGEDTLLLTIPKIFINERIIIPTNGVDRQFAEEQGFERKNLDSLLDSSALEDSTLLISLSKLELEKGSIGKKIEKLTQQSYYKVTTQRKFTKFNISGMTKVDVNTVVDKSFTWMKSYLPIIMLLVVPFFAFLVAFQYRKKKVNYMGHLVFSLHFSAVQFILLFVVMLLAAYLKVPANVLIITYLCYIVLYLTAASHYVYSGTSWVKAFLKSILILLGYFFILIFVALIITVLMFRNVITEIF